MGCIRTHNYINSMITRSLTMQAPSYSNHFSSQPQTYHFVGETMMLTLDFYLKPTSERNSVQATISNILNTQWYLPYIPTATTAQHAIIALSSLFDVETKDQEAWMHSNALHRRSIWTRVYYTRRDIDAWQQHNGIPAKCLAVPRKQPAGTKCPCEQCLKERPLRRWQHSVRAQTRIISEYVFHFASHTSIEDLCGAGE